MSHHLVRVLATTIIMVKRSLLWCKAGTK